MKICIVTPAVIRGDGQGRANYEITWEAIRRGYEVTVVTSRVESDLQEHQNVVWINPGGDFIPSQLLKSVFFILWSRVWLLGKRRDFDIVQIYGAATLGKSDFNTVQFVHSAWMKSPVHTSKTRKDLYGLYQWIYTKLNSVLERQAFHSAKSLIVVSERVKEEVIEIGVCKDKIHLIYNGVDINEFSPGQSCRDSIGLPSDVIIGLFAGDIKTNRKNLDSVLCALRDVPDLHLAVVGGLESSPYPKLTEKLGINQRVHFLGYRQDLPNIMRSCNFFIFPSRYEPFGMVILEAMSVGIPIITSKSAGASEVASHDCGLIIDSEDTDALRNAMFLLASNSEIRESMGHRGREIAEHHSWVSKAANYLDLFEEACSV